MNDRDGFKSDDIKMYWDYKLTIFVVAVIFVVSWYVMHDQIYLDDDSVYSRDGNIAEVISCGGGLNSKSIVVKDESGNVMVWAGNSCEGVKNRLVGSRYEAYFSKKIEPEDPIYLKIDGNIAFKPGFERTEFGAIILLSGFISFFGSLFILKMRKKSLKGTYKSL